MYVSAILTGGLGNRLFQVATAKAYGKKYNKEFVFDRFLANETGHGELDNIYKLFPMIKNISDIQYSHTFKEIPNTHYIYEELNDVKDNCIIHGYRQSWKYFLDTKIILNFENVLGNACLFELYRTYLDKTVFTNLWFIHFRFGDFDILPHHQINRRRYYFEAINRLPIAVKVLILSDDLEKCKEYIEYLDYLKIQYTIVSNTNEVEALYIMSRCYGGAIVANSTFSWWGSYLAHQENSNHRAFYPSSNGIGLPSPTDYIPPWGTSIMNVV